MNPLDNKKTGDVYLTHCGSCIETGDEGVVGRGNRIGGLIRINRAMSMEGICGKNPCYHTGKVLAGAAYEIMQNTDLNQNTEATIYLVGQRGRSLEKPWSVVLEAPTEYLNANLKKIEENIEYTLSNLGKITEKFLKREIPLC
ncbi:MAG: methionine adenosyltransferase [Candidatus Woesearchaeota archaeon]